MSAARRNGAGATRSRAGELTLDEAQAVETELWRRVARLPKPLGGRQVLAVKAVELLTLRWRKLSDDPALPVIARVMFGYDGPRDHVTENEWDAAVEALAAAHKKGVIRRRAPRGRPSKVAERRYVVSVAHIAADLGITLTPGNDPLGGGDYGSEKTPSDPRKHPPPIPRNDPLGGGTPTGTTGTAGEGSREQRETAPNAAHAAPPSPPSSAGTDTDPDRPNVERWRARCVRYNAGEVENEVAIASTAHGREVVERFLDWLDAQDAMPDLTPSRYRYPRQLADELNDSAADVRSELDDEDARSARKHKESVSGHA